LDSRNAVSYAHSWTPVAVGTAPPLATCDAMRSSLLLPRSGTSCQVDPRLAGLVPLSPHVVSGNSVCFPCSPCAARPLLVRFCLLLRLAAGLCLRVSDEERAPCQFQRLRSEPPTTRRRFHQFTGLRVMRAGEESEENIRAAPWPGLACARYGSRSPAGPACWRLHPAPLPLKRGGRAANARAPVRETGAAAAGWMDGRRRGHVPVDHHPHCPLATARRPRAHPMCARHVPCLDCPPPRTQQGAGPN